ncbi:GyrI-like domain-containing protein [Acetobacterium malicum]|uniref:GyrI-like domain-containing protein n=1 Tax=Acetobacterium malicum TaxID=52692 RepID=UPI003592EE95
MSRKLKKANDRLDQLRLEDYDEGSCCQMLHLSSYDDEPASFAQMEAFCSEHGYRRSDKTHREIYLSDPRRTETAKLKTVLRFKVETD